MLRIFLCGIAILFCVIAEAQIRVPAGFHTLYIPGGFDSNDNVQFVGEGWFRSSCYRPATTDFKVDQQSKEIEIAPSAFEYYGFCLQVMLPYDRELNLGILNPGTYKIKQNQEIVGEVKVAEAKVTTADEAQYAPINQAFIIKSEGVYQYGIVGDLTNSCMYLDRVEVIVEPQVIVLRPIVGMQPRRSCRDGIFQFSKFGRLGDVKKGRYLLHVRSMNGNSVNSLVSIQ